jgi:predicted ATPase/DNA-binding CsgD family transcriptional regulator
MASTLPALGRQRFPVPVTTLIGRGADVDAVVDVLLQPDVPLVTVTGPGGVGKTRLALEVGERLANTWRDGVWFVPLASVREAERVLPAIAQALGLREDGGSSMALLTERLRDAEMLLILDNMEQVAGVATELSLLLADSPGLRMLVTSRTILRLSIETVCQLDVLALPPASPMARASDVAEVEAVRLFVERARASNRTFELTDANAAVVADICRRLDGLPLAIELAAARAKLLSPAALQARLARRLTVLTGGPVDQPARQRTMQAAVEWSFELLGPYEQAVLRRLGAIAGPISLDAAESVVGEGDEADVLEAMSSLVDQSLLQALPVPGDEPRFRMLQTIHEFAEEMLDALGETDVVRRRHADYYLAFSEEAAPHLTGSDQVTWLNAIETARDDLQNAFEWYLAHDKPAHALRLAVATWRFGYTRGHYSEARERLQRAIERNPEPTPARVMALNAEGLLACVQGAVDVATARHEEALRGGTSLGDELGVAVAHNGLGDAAAFAGCRDDARRHYTEALRRFRQLGERRGIAGALTNLGNLYWDERALTTSVALHEEALEHYRAIDDLRGIAWSLMNLGSLAVDLGDLPLGARHLRDGMSIYRKLGDRSGIVVTLEGFAEIAEARGHEPLAVRLYAAASAIREETGAPIPASDRARYDGVLAGLRRRLGQEFDAAWATGELMSLDDAVSDAFDVGMGQARPESVAVRPAEAVSGLTRREIEVLELVARGKTNNEIADRLSISVRTASTHVSNILGKLDLPNRSAAAAYAHRAGLV